MSIKSDERKKQILEAASICFRKNGFHKTTMQDICKEVGMSPGSLYRYFSGKEEIVVAIARIESSEGHVALKSLKETDDFVGNLKDNIEPMLTKMTNSDFVSLFAEISSESNRSELIKITLQNISNNISILFAAAIKQNQDCGKIRESLNPEITASIIMALFDGIALRSCFSNSMNTKECVDAISDLLECWLKK